MVDYEINKSKYITLVGDVQSGKTNEELKYCYESINVHKVPVIFIVRNITADQLQLKARIDDFNNKNNTNLKSKILSHVDIQSAATFMESLGIIILLCNSYQSNKIKKVLGKYHGDYHLCIDEVDFSIKSKNNSSKIDYNLSLIKQGAKHVLGATATPVALFSGDKCLSKVKKLKAANNYHGIESLNINYIRPNITRDPRSDIESIQEIYSSLLLKDHSILLHTVSKFKEYHIDLAEYIFDLFPQFTVLTYNGDGIRILTCRLINVKKVTSNNYGQLINKYHYSDGVHHFKNYSISEVLQIIKDHSHISIISGNLASRGISFVSSDYSIHLTDQYFVPGKKTHGESYLQSLRILGCYNDSKDLTLWCTERTWELIFQHNNFVYNLVKNINSEKDWLTKLQKIKILKPDTSLTRPKLTKGTKFNRVPHSNHFNFCIEYQEEPEEEIEEDI
jgi:hypothetical protein